MRTHSQPYPSENCSVWNFESNYKDHKRIDPWVPKTDLDFSSLYKKFGRFSLTATPGNKGDLAMGRSATVGKSLAAGFWTHIEIAGGKDDVETNILLFELWFITGSRIQILMQKQEYSNDFKFILYLKKQTDSDSIVIEDIQNSNAGTWNYTGFVYNAEDDEMFLCVNNRKIRSGKLGGSWPGLLSDPNYFYTLYIHPFNSCTTTTGFLIDVRIDELLFCPDQYISPSTFGYHFTKNVPWGEYVP